MGADRSTTDDTKLLQALSEGNPEAFTTLYHRYGARLHAHLFRMIKSEDLAREMFQDIFMKIWEVRERIAVDKPFGAYLYRIAENKVYDHFRKVARDKRLAENIRTGSAHFHNDTEDRVAYQDSFRLINQAIEQLPPVRRQIYILSKIEGKSYEEIAGLMGISTSTINDHIVRANRFLKKVLTADAVVLWVILFSV